MVAIMAKRPANGHRWPQLWLSILLVSTLALSMAPQVQSQDKPSSCTDGVAPVVLGEANRVPRLSDPSIFRQAFGEPWWPTNTDQWIWNSCDADVAAPAGTAVFRTCIYIAGYYEAVYVYALSTGTVTIALDDGEPEDALVNGNPLFVGGDAAGWHTITVTVQHTGEGPVGLLSTFKKFDYTDLYTLPSYVNGTGGAESGWTTPTATYCSPPPPSPEVSPPIPPPPFVEILDLSYQFYEAQLSGYIPEWASSSESKGGWRRDSHTTDGFSADGGPDAQGYYPGVALDGGYYLDGGHLKVTHPMAAAASLMAYGALNWLPNRGGPTFAYLHAAEVAKYLVKCHYAANKFAAQVGDQYTDDVYWGRPESQPSGGPGGSDSWRPVWSINAAEGRGADVVAQAAAALAAAAVLEDRAGVSASEVTGVAVKAAELYDMAKSLHGVFIVPQGNITGLSRTYMDDMCWAAAWLCRLEVERGVSSAPRCIEALSRWDAMTELPGTQPYLSTDNFGLGCAMLLRDTMGLRQDSFRSDPTYLSKFNGLIGDALEWWTVRAASTPCDPCKEKGVCVTPDGFTILQQHASAHLTANMALVALSSANPSPTPALDLSEAKQKARRCWAHRQVSYLLGENSARQAFVVGLDRVPSGLSHDIKVPTRPRHRGAACDKDTGLCVQPDQPNPNVLAGALVGGPTGADGFTDRRDDTSSLVSIEYNAGFTAALAALSSLEGELAATGSSLADYCKS